MLHYQPAQQLDRFDPNAPHLAANPYPIYQHFRTHDPVHQGKPPNLLSRYCWYLFNYQDVLAALKDPRLGREQPDTAPHNSWPANTFSSEPDWLIYRDPPHHTDLRIWLHKSISMIPNTFLEELFVDCAGGLLNKMPPNGRLNFLTDFAEKLPLQVLAGLMGFDRPGIESFSQVAGYMLAPSWQDRRTIFTQRLVAGQFRPRLVRLLLGLIHKRLASPQADLISSLIKNQVVLRSYDEAELVSNCLHLLVAGYEGSVNLLANGLHALLSNQVQFQLLKANIDLEQQAVEELARYDSPIQMVDRWVLEDCEIKGKSLKRGERLYLVIGAANRDPSQFSEPDQLNFERLAFRNLSFGAGLHACIGARLAGLQARLTFRLLTNLFDKLELVEKIPVWRPDPNFRALKRLNLDYTKEVFYG